MTTQEKLLSKYNALIELMLETGIATNDGVAPKTDIDNYIITGSEPRIIKDLGRVCPPSLEYVSCHALVYNNEIYAPAFKNFKKYMLRYIAALNKKEVGLCAYNQVFYLLDKLGTQCLNETEVKAVKTAMKNIREALIAQSLPNQSDFMQLNNTFASLKKQLSAEKHSILGDKIIRAFLRFRKALTYSLTSKQALEAKIIKKDNAITASQLKAASLSHCTSSFTLFSNAVKPAQNNIQARIDEEAEKERYRKNREMRSRYHYSNQHYHNAPYLTRQQEQYILNNLTLGDMFAIEPVGTSVAVLGAIFG